MLNEEERKEFWATFKNSPLFKEWKDAEKTLHGQFDRQPFRPGEIVFHAGDSADYLYLVGSGVISQSSKQDGVEWLHRRFTSGDYFGQHALFGDKHHSDAVAETDGVLYKMFAGHLRTAMERNSGLYETLLQEKRASRLRSIPLFRALTDSQIMRLSLVTEEVNLGRGEAVPLGQKPGVWIIDAGQVTITGPASLGRPKWRLTAGNFFFAPGAQRGARCIATTASAYLASRCFYLPADHIEHLANAFADVGRLIAQPVDIVAALMNAAPLRQAGLTDVHCEHLAQFCAWSFVPERQNITTQGALGHSFVILREGAAMVTNFDEQGRTRPQNYLRPGSAYGETSLLEGRPRDATVRAVAAPPAAGGVPGLRGADVITLDRRDLQIAFVEDRALWDSRVNLYKNFKGSKDVKPLFSWQNPDETILWAGRSHIFWLLGPLMLPVGVTLVTLLLALALPLPQRNALLVVWFLLLGFMGLLAAWFIINYLDDHYVVTNRRVTRYDRQLLSFSETLMEAPIETIQDVTVKATFWGRFFDWGDLTIRTAAKVGAIVFANVPEPELHKRSILEGKAQAVAVARGQQKEVLRRLLIANLRVVLPIPERQRALGEDVQLPESGLLSQLQRPWRSLNRAPRSLPASQSAWPKRFLRWITQPLPERMRKALAVTAPPPQQPLSGEIIWHRHPIALLKRAWAPFLASIVLLAASFRFEQLTAVLSLNTMSLVLPWLLLMIVTIGILAYQVADYRNDMYVLTDDKIIDIEMKPFGLDYKRREGNLERVQSVDFRRLGLLSVIFDYGTVTIRTAAADEGYDFIMVPDPKHVQEVVFQKLDALRQRQEAKKVEDRQREMIESLQVYDDIRGMGEREGTPVRFS